ncbi:MAG: thiamine-phosphate kinase [Parachlamydiaceae bacterium]
MSFQDWGEERFIQYLAKQFPSTNFIVGIGDDCAVIPGEQGMAWLVTTDALVEGVHFLKDQIAATDLGYKTVAVNVSDITAMGGEPKYAFLSIALPNAVDSTWVCNVIQGVKDACEKWEILLLGGDTVGSKRDLFFNLTLMGSAMTARIKYRHQAEVGDVICVSGYLGESGGGLKALQEKTAKTKDIEYLLRAHFHPEPNPKQGIWLAAQSGVHAMIDISDGLDCDLTRLIKSSQKGAVIETSKLPLSGPLIRVSLEHGWDTLELALTGGEDYCLLLTVSADAFESIQNSFQSTFRLPLFDIGHITSQSEELIYHRQGEVIQTRYTNFDHFQ